MTLFLGILEVIKESLKTRVGFRNDYLEVMQHVLRLNKVMFSVH